MRVTLPYGLLERKQNIRCANLPLGGFLEKCPKSSVCTYHNMDFRKNAEHLMCDLTTKWILESAHCFSVCTYISCFIYVLSRGTGCSEGSCMLIDDPL